MRKIAICLLAMAFILITVMPVLAQDRQLRQHHSIEIEVECLETAMDILRGLNGYNLDSSVFLHESGRQGAQRWGHFTRRVDYWAYAHVQDALRDLGDVIYESQNAHFLGTQIIDADARIAALTQEIERLSIMLAGSESLDVLIAIDARLSQVAMERNRVIGTRNVLAAQAASPVIHINLLEVPEGRPEVVPDRFGSRVAGTFMASLRITGTVAGHLLVFAARVSIPALIYAALLFAAVYIGLKIKRRQAGTPVLEMADMPVEETMQEPAWVGDKEGEK